MCRYLRQGLGTKFTLCIVLIQQQSPSQLRHVTFEALYRRKCRTPLMWSEVGECTLVGPNLIKEAEDKVAEIREKLKATQSRQESYANKRR
jgi:hypothetical protein